MTSYKMQLIVNQTNTAQYGDTGGNVWQRSSKEIATVETLSQTEIRGVFHYSIAVCNMFEFYSNKT